MKTTGYFKEYYVGTKFIGRKDSGKDRDKFGFDGMKKHIAESDIKFKNKNIKKGTEYRTILYPYIEGRK